MSEFLDEFCSTATTLTPISASKKRGCPTCDGVAPKSCMRCKGKARLCDWYMTANGTVHRPTEMPSST
jgi:hypothetical protein